MQKFSLVIEEDLSERSNHYIIEYVSETCIRCSKPYWSHNIILDLNLYSSSNLSIYNM